MRVTPTPSSIPDAIRRQLGPGEQLLWHGQPRRGMLLRRADAVTIPLGLACCWSVWPLEAPAWTDVPLSTRWLPALGLLAGGCLALGRPIVDARGRADTWYGVTGERVIIVSGVLARSVKSLNLATLAELTLLECMAGEGTIVFGPEPPALAALVRGGGPARALQPRRAPRFDRIADAAAVHALILDAQRRARAGTKAGV